MYKVIGADKKQYGPVSTDQIRQWIRDGRLNRQSLVQAEGASQWNPLGAVPEFAAVLPSAAGPAAMTTGAGGEAKTSGLAVASLVLGILGLFTCGATALVGLILGIVALVKIQRSHGRLSGGGLAIAGLGVSGVLLLLAPLCAAMLLPALAKAKERAQTINCLNNAKQLGLAVRLYANDHQGKLPPTATWCDAIQKYVNSPRAFQCPADRGSRCSYAFNAKLEGKQDGEINPQTVMLFESRAGWNGTGEAGSLEANKHWQGVVVGFADGSVRIVTRSQLGTLRWDP